MGREALVEKYKDYTAVLISVKLLTEFIVINTYGQDKEIWLSVYPKKGPTPTQREVLVECHLTQLLSYSYYSFFYQRHERKEFRFIAKLREIASMLYDKLKNSKKS